MANQTIKLKIDGIEVEVEKGTSILEAAQSASIRIPSLCHDRRLVPFGACRLCMVEEKGKSELIPSCFTPAKNGMEIITTSPKIIESRKIQLQLLLLNHPMTCPRCEKEGECDLQDLIYEYGVADVQYPWDPIPLPVDQSPLLQRDANKCILCGRCVRICDEVQGVRELSFTRRGIQTVIDTDFHRPLQCEFCGQCLDTCPVGAITSDCFGTKTKFWELTETTTPCPYCSVGCLLTIGSKGGQIKRVYALPDQGPNDGNLCVRGRFGWDMVDHPERLTSPALRVNGRLQEASWEEALRSVAVKLEEIKNKYGPQSIGAVLSSRLTNEEFFLSKKLFKEAIGTEQIALNGAPGDQGLAEGLAKTLGCASSTNSIKEIRKADCILIIGVDPAQTHPIIKNEIHFAIRKNKAQLIVLGPYDIGLSQATLLSPLFPASIFLPTKIGEELSLLQAMCAFLLKHGLENQEFVNQRTQGVEELRTMLEGEPLDLSQEERDRLEKAGRAFAQSKRAMILIGSGPWSRSYSEKVGSACANLALLTGHIGREGSGILLLLQKCNSQGAIDIGISGPKEVKDLIQQAEDGHLKALYLVGQNPPLSHKALENLELLVVQDLFFTEAAKKAHAVFPACSFVEKSGTYTNLERRIQKLHPFRAPTGQSKSDFEIFIHLLRHFEISLPEETQEAIFQEISKTIPSYRGLREGEQWPKEEAYLYRDGFPSGKATFAILVQSPPKRRPDGFPFYLVEKPSLFRSGELSLRSEHLRKVMEKPSLEINTEDAHSLNLEEGELVELLSPSGKSVRMKVHLSSAPARGVVTVHSPCPLIEEEWAWVKVERQKK